MGDLAQEMWDMAQHNFEACCRLDKRLGNNYSAYRYAEQRIAELEAEVSQWKTSMGMAIAERDEVIEELEREVERLREAVDLVILKHRVRKERGTLVYFELPSEELEALAALLGGGG